MKKAFLSIALSLSLAFQATAVPNLFMQFQFSVGVIKPTHGGGHPFPKSPINPPHAVLDDHQLTIETGHPEFILIIKDDEENVVYQTVVPENVDSVSIPSSITGNYQLQVFPGGNFYFYYDITL